MMYGAERTPDFEETLRTAMDGRQSSMWTAMPGYVVSYDPTGSGTGSPTVSVQLGIQGTVLDAAGTYNQVNLPLLPDVPVVFLNGGGVTLTYPIRPSDECLVVFASRCIDYWWNAGGIQPSIDLRKHDINDGFALVGPRSRKRPLGAISDSTAQLRSDDGSVFIEIDPAGHIVNIVAPGGLNVTAPTSTFNGAVNVVGGAVTSNVDVYAQTVSLFGHEQSGVQSGTSTSGPPIGGGGASAAGSTASSSSGTSGASAGTISPSNPLPVADVAGAAPSASPAFTGTPTTPTPAANDNTDQIANTAYVVAAIAALAATLGAEIGNAQSGASNAQTSAAAAAPLSSPAFTGTPTAPTPAANAGGTQLATVAYVAQEIATVAGNNTGFSSSAFVAWMQSLPKTPPTQAGIPWLNAGALCLS